MTCHPHLSLESITVAFHLIIERKIEENEKRKKKRAVFPCVQEEHLLGTESDRQQQQQQRVGSFPSGRLWI